MSALLYIVNIKELILANKNSAGGTVFDFRRLQRWALGPVASSLVVEYSPVPFIYISAQSLRVFTAEFIFSCVLADPAVVVY